ncbi:type VI secretion system tube protein Hcp [Solirubrobacter taibaiensis]|nr:type VI secretion system tube protein Hcp [Solirubrobacter taibaiensis]
MNRFLPISLLATTAVMALAAPVANAAIYIRVDGIKGAVSDSHTGQIRIASRPLDAPSAAAAGGGASAGKVHYSDLSVMISLEKSPSLLNLAIAEGQHFDALELTFRAPATQARGEMQHYYTVTLENVLVSSYQTSAKEISFSINFTNATSDSPAGNGTGKTMAAEVLASTLGHTAGANLLLADGSVRFIN